MAASYGHIENVKWLIEKGAEIDTVDNNGLSIFDHCKKYSEVTEFLMKMKEKP